MILTSLQKARFEPSKVNLLLSLLHEMQEDPGLSAKFKAIGLLEHMRINSKVQDFGLIKGQPPGSQLPDHRKPVPEGEEKAPAEEDGEAKPLTNDVTSTAAFEGVRLSQDEENDVYLELGEYLLDKSLCGLAKKVISKVTDQNSVKVLFNMAKSKMLLLEIHAAADDLAKIWNELSPDMIEAHVLYGHCKYMLDEFEASKDAYMRAIRIANMQKSELKDPLLHQRLGQILIESGMFSDAKVIFEMCADKYETAFSFMNLGIACLHLEDYASAEKVLMKANVLDIQNSNVWGYMTLVMLKSGNRLNSAF